MVLPIVLASSSNSRAAMLTHAGIAHEVSPASIDEQMIKASLQAEGATPRDVADVLAEFKAEKVSKKHPRALVIGSDQVLALGKSIYSKSPTPEALIATLKELRGQTHTLYSAAVVYEEVKPVWRHVTPCRMTMADLSDAFIVNYVQTQWEDVRWSVGGYLIETTGAQLFTRVQGDTFSIMGLPLLELQAYLRLRGEIAQ